MPPEHIGQSSVVSYADAGTNLTPLPNQEAFRVSLHDRYGHPSNKCSLVVALGDSSGRVLPVAHLALGVGLSVQSRSVPECVLPADNNKKQRKRFKERKANLDCEDGGGWYSCQNDAGDEFATCDADDCDM